MLMSRRRWELSKVFEGKNCCESTVTARECVYAMCIKFLKAGWSEANLPKAATKENFKETRPIKLCKHLISNFETFLGEFWWKSDGKYLEEMFWRKIFGGELLVENIR